VFRITTIDEAFADVDATLITFDHDVLTCWTDPAVHPVARYRLGQVRSVQAIEPLGQSASLARPRATPEFPNAFRRWTEEDERAVIEAYHRGDSFEQIAAAVGRRVGGVRARLVALNVIEAEPGDRLSYPGFLSPAVSAGASGGRAGGARPRLSVVRPHGEVGALRKRQVGQASTSTSSEVGGETGSTRSGDGQDADGVGRAVGESGGPPGERRDDSSGEPPQPSVRVR
jgi:hypothetical protein